MDCCVSCTSFIAVICAHEGSALFEWFIMHVAWSLSHLSVRLSVCLSVNDTRQRRELFGAISRQAEVTFPQCGTRNITDSKYAECKGKSWGQVKVIVCHVTDVACTPVFIQQSNPSLGLLLLRLSVQWHNGRRAACFLITHAPAWPRCLAN